MRSGNYCLDPATIAAHLVMKVCYSLPSPTWGMHQYTADLANRMARAGHEVHVVTTRHAPRDRYAPDVSIHTPITTRDTGFSLDALRPRDLHALQRVVQGLEPDLVHFTGPHLWNPMLLGVLRRKGIPTIHTLHDLHPHRGAIYGRLLYPWNAWVRREAGHILVHGQRYRDELEAQGVAPSRLTCTLLTHLFLSDARERELAGSPPAVNYEPWGLFLGRLEPYKGLKVLLEAAQRLEGQRIGIIIAGPGRLEPAAGRGVPGNVEVRNCLVDDEQASDLFRRCALLVLPYVEASQSALVAAAYFFRKPVIVTEAGALQEYVVAGETGWVIPPGDPQALAETLQVALADPSRLAQMGGAGHMWYQRQRKAEGRILQEMYASLLNKSL